MAKFYTGIGSKRTPFFILVKMKRISRTLNKKGYTLRSGAAKGADEFFEYGSTRKEIFLPFQGFNNSPSLLHKANDTYHKVASSYVKYFNDVSDEEKAFIARDVRQVINNGVKSDFLICWTRDGATDISFNRRRTGGTWYAIALASLLGVQVINLKNFTPSRIKKPLSNF